MARTISTVGVRGPLDQAERSSAQDRAVERLDQLRQADLTSVVALFRSLVCHPAHRESAEHRQGSQPASEHLPRGRAEDRFRKVPDEHPVVKHTE